MDGEGEGDGLLAAVEATAGALIHSFSRASLASPTGVGSRAEGEEEGSVDGRREARSKGTGEGEGDGEGLGEGEG